MQFPLNDLDIETEVMRQFKAKAVSASGAIGTGLAVLLLAAAVLLSALHGPGSSLSAIAAAGLSMVFVPALNPRRDSVQKNLALAA
jgi:hypothetical protein